MLVRRLLQALMRRPHWARAPSALDCTAEYIAEGAKMFGCRNTPWQPKIQGNSMYPPMTAKGLGVLCVGITHIDAVVDDFAVIKLRYGSGPGVPLVSKAWTCPAATANLFDNSSCLILD